MKSGAIESREAKAARDLIYVYGDTAPVNSAIEVIEALMWSKVRLLRHVVVLLCITAVLGLALILEADSLWYGVLFWACAAVEWFSWRKVKP